MNVKLVLLKAEDEEQFIKDNQTAFNFGAEQYFNKEELEKQYEEEEQIISRKTIIDSIHYKNAVAYRIIADNQIVGGVVIVVNGEEGELELLFVNPSCHSKGVGQAAWKEIERLYPDVKLWETYTPYFEKKNLHFYINKLGFNVVEYFNEKHRGSMHNLDMTDMFRFQKIIK